MKARSRSIVPFGLIGLGLIGFAGGATLVSLSTNLPPTSDSIGSSREREERKHGDPLAYARFRYVQRLSEDGTVPENALMTAKKQRDALLALQGRFAGGVAPPNWTWAGPGNIGGRIRAILVHPSNPNTMWLGACSGGIWKTTNGGVSWFPLDDFMPTLAIGCMAMDPTNPDVIYAGTGEGFFETVEGSSNTAAVRGAGIFKTTDGGATWEQLPSTANSDFYFVNRIAIDPQNPNTLLAATQTGIWRSTDGGNSWSQRTTSLTYDIQYHPTDGTKAVAGLHDGPAQYSTDGGLTWSNATGLSGHRVEVRYAKSSPTTVYAAVSNNGRIVVYRSTNGGQSYTLQTSGSGITTYEAYNSVIWVDPTNPNTVLLGGVYLYRSTNAGASFSQVFTSVHADQHVIIEAPGFNGSSNKTVFFGHDGGISRTLDVYASSSTNLNNNLGITQLYGASINNTSGVIVAGSQDNGSMRYTGGVNSWGSVLGGDGGFCASDPTDPNYHYAEYQYGRINRSTNGGSSFSQITSGLPSGNSTNFNFIPYFLLDPNNPNRMLLAGRELWRTNNVKASTPSWASIKGPLQFAPDPPLKSPDTAHFADNPPWHISTIAIAEGNSDIIWVGYNRGEVWKTTNGTATTPTWTRVDTNGPLPERWVSRIAIDRNNHNKVWVAFMGWADNNVWVTEDGGVTWQQKTGTGAMRIPAAPASAITVHRTKSDWIYVGTDIGMFTSSDGGNTWTVITDGPGTVPIEELIWRNDTTLMAVTHGRGVFFATINTTKEPFVPTTYQVTRGIYSGGRLQDVYISDDMYLRAYEAPALSTFDPSVQFEFAATSPVLTGNSLRIRLEAGVSALPAASVHQSVELFNFQTNMWDVVDSRAASATDAAFDINISSNPSRYVDQVNRTVRLRVSFFDGGVLFTPGWQARIDQVLFEMSI